MRSAWHPHWWKEEEHGTAWTRIRDAVKRDWEQTKKDLHVGGHELNQNLSDTVKQSAGKEAIPPFDKANPPRVIGNWDDVELPVGYGYAARQKYGAQHAQWNENLESSLRTEWNEGKEKTGREWNDVSRWVRHGYEYTPNK